MAHDRSVRPVRNSEPSDDDWPKSSVGESLTDDRRHLQQPLGHVFDQERLLQRGTAVARHADTLRGTEKRGFRPLRVQTVLSPVLSSGLKKRAFAG